MKCNLSGVRIGKRFKRETHCCFLLLEFEPPSTFVRTRQKGFRRFHPRAHSTFSWQVVFGDVKGRKKKKKPNISQEWEGCSIGASPTYTSTAIITGLTLAVIHFTAASSSSPPLSGAMTRAPGLSRLKVVTLKGRSQSRCLPPDERRPFVSRLPLTGGRRRGPLIKPNFADKSRAGFLNQANVSCARGDQAPPGQNLPVSCSCVEQKRSIQHDRNAQRPAPFILAKLMLPLPERK